MFDRSQICFVLLPGFAPDAQPVFELREALRKKGYHAIASNFWGKGAIQDFSQLTIPQCQEGVARLIRNAAQRHSRVIGVGICLGGALFLGHAKNETNLHGIVSIGTPFRLRYRTLRYIGELLLPFVYPLWRRIDAMKKEWRLLPVGAGPTVVRYLEREFLQGLDRIRTPALFLHSKKDPIADYGVLAEFLSKISSREKRLITLEKKDHVADGDADLVVRHLLEFFSLPEGEDGVRKERGAYNHILQPEPVEVDLIGLPD
jgi:esterase/lipase